MVIAVLSVLGGFIPGFWAFLSGRAILKGTESVVAREEARIKKQEAAVTRLEDSLPGPCSEPTGSVFVVLIIRSGRTARVRLREECQPLLRERLGPRLDPLDAHTMLPGDLLDRPPLVQGEQNLRA